MVPEPLSPPLTTVHVLLQGNCTDFQEGSEHHANYMWLFLLGQLLHGAGASPLYTLGVTFIDENVSKKMSSVYLGKCAKKRNYKFKSRGKHCVNPGSLLFVLRYSTTLFNLHR
jgi:hypothetical protein